METPQYPSNSKSMPPDAEPRKAERVVTSEVKSRPKPLGRRLREALLGGDSKSALQYVIGEVIIPHAKDLLSEATTQMVERIIFGESRGGYRRPANRTSGYTNYSGISSRNRPTSSIRVERPVMRRRTQELDELVFETRAEAQAVLEEMYERLEEYGIVSVADLMTMVDKTSTHIDQKWGWDDLHGSQIKMVRDGYLLILPKTTTLD